MHWQDNFPFEARRRRNSGSRSGCVGGWRPASWPGGSVGPGACPCSAASARHVATCATIAGRSATMGLDTIPGAQTGGVRRPAAARSAAASCARGGLMRWCVARGGGPARGARGGGAGRRGPPTGWPRLRLLREILDELVPGVEQFLLVNNVVAVEDGTALVPGQEHGDPLGNGRADQVAGGGAPAIVEEAGWHPGRLAGGAPRRAPAADGDAVAVEDQRAVGVAACPPSRQGLGDGVMLRTVCKSS